MEDEAGVGRLAGAGRGMAILGFTTETGAIDAFLEEVATLDASLPEDTLIFFFK